MRRKRERQRTRTVRAKEPAVRKTTAPQKPKKEHRGLKRFRNGVLVVIFISILTVFGIGVGMYISVEKEIRDMNVQNLAINYSSLVYYTDADGNSYELEQLFNNGNRVWIDSSEIPDVLKDAIVSIEDERFYNHGGVDIKRSAGAFLGWVKEQLGLGTSSYGGSTITQQVIKNITLEKDRTPARKIKEMMRAVALEKQLSKDEILTTYLNLVFLANNCYGVEAASNLYFDKNAIDLTLPEAAMIAGITQRPSYYDPIKNPENAKDRRDTVLWKMWELGKITEEEYQEAVSSELNLNPNYNEAKSKNYSYFVENLINEIISDLQTEKGYTDTFAEQLVYSGGLKIYATVDPDIQQAIEDVFTNNANFPSTKNPAQAAMIITDPYTGEIKGMVGCKGEKTDRRGYNRATQMTRQPGSSMKPLSVYAPSIDTGLLTAASIVNDEKLTIGDWSPQNSYSGYRGYMIVRRALEISANTPAVRTLQDLGVDKSYEYVQDKFHISTLADADRDLSPLALGGLTNGVSPKEMAAAYGVFASGGIYNKPHSYTKIVDNTGKVLLENEPENTRVLKDSTAFIMTDLLYSVVNGSSGTGRAAKLSSMPTYGKTGTTNDDYDKWFIGFTPYYVGAVWYGFDTPASVRKAGVYNNPSVTLWKSVMEKVHEDLPEREFTAPDSVEKVLVCARTGRLASKGCDYAQYEYFEHGTAPEKYCNNASSYNGSSSGSSSSRTTRPRRTASPDDDSEIEEELQNRDDVVQETPDSIADNSGNSDSTSPPATNTPTQNPTQAPTQRPTAPPATQAPSSGNEGAEDVITLD